MIKLNGMALNENTAFWNEDQTLASAFKRSCVWCYQRYTRQISHETYIHYLKQFNYGNAKTGGDIETFWLDGELRISPLGQIDFLKRVYHGTLPVNSSHLKVLKSIMHARSSTGLDLYAKTGWSGKNGWYVGYIKTPNNVWFFATHLLIESSDMLPLRRRITEDSLRALGIVE